MTDYYDYNNKKQLNPKEKHSQKSTQNHSKATKLEEKSRKKIKKMT